MGRKETGPAAWEYPFQEESAWKKAIGAEISVPELPPSWQEALPSFRKEGYSPWFIPDLGIGQMLKKFNGAPTEQATELMLRQLHERFPEIAPRKRHERFLRKHMELSQMQYVIGPFPAGQWVLTTDARENFVSGAPLTRYINMPQTRWHNAVEGSGESMALYNTVSALCNENNLTECSTPSVPTALEQYLLRIRGAITPVAAEWTSTKVLGPAKTGQLSCEQDGVQYVGRRFDFNYLYVDGNGQMGIQHGREVTTRHRHLKEEVLPPSPLTLRPLIRQDKRFGQNAS
jgi:hypothetical protein